MPVCVAKQNCWSQSEAEVQDKASDKYYVNQETAFDTQDNIWREEEKEIPVKTKRLFTSLLDNVECAAKWDGKHPNLHTIQPK